MPGWLPAAAGRCLPERAAGRPGALPARRRGGERLAPQAAAAARRRGRLVQLLGRRKGLRTPAAPTRGLLPFRDQRVTRRSGPGQGPPRDLAGAGTVRETTCSRLRT